MQDKLIKNQFYIVETLQIKNKCYIVETLQIIALYTRMGQPIVTKQTLFYSEF